MYNSKTTDSNFDFIVKIFRKIRVEKFGSHFSQVCVSTMHPVSSITNLKNYELI